MSKKDPNKKGFFAEFKEFITRGNVIDMAVGVIIGGAFTAIVTALTSGILQPIINYLIGLIMGDASLEAARTILGNPVYTVNDLNEKVIDWAKTNYIDWGTFISAIINFIILAFVLFLMLKAVNKAMNLAKKPAEPEPEPEPVKSDETKALEEIIELLKKQQG